MPDWEEPDIRDVATAARRIAGLVHRTPAVRSRSADDRAGRPVWMKAEHLQKTGSYKARGAINHALLARERHGTQVTLVAASSGNHGQAVAWAAQTLGLKCVVVAPRSISAAKRSAIAGYGAQLELVDNESGARLARARELAEKLGAQEVPPYDHPDTIAGQGTWVLEMQDVLGELETIVVPVSGGGLAAGTVTAVRSLAPEVRVIGVEPAGADDTRRSIEAGRRLRVEPDTVADALRASEPGELTFRVLQGGLHDVLTVTDEEIRHAMGFAFSRMKQVLEPGGAAALALALSGRVGGGGMCVVLSGGNISVADFTDLVHPGHLSAKPEVGMI